MKRILLFRQGVSQAFKDFKAWVLSDGGVVESDNYVNSLMNRSKNASIVQIPSAYKSEVLYNQIPISPDNDDFTVARASDVWRTNEQGVLEVLGNNVPCIDYSDGFPVLLTQPQSTNLITYSEDFSNASWNKTGTSVVGGQSSPDGLTNAFKLVEDSSLGDHYITIGVITVTSGATTASAFYAKKGERNWVFISNPSVDTSRVWFDLENGVIGTINGGVDSAKITAVGNGWYRCQAVYTVASTQSRIAIYESTGDGVISYQGDGTSGIYIFGAQLEELSYPTSYIPTSGATATRLGDAITGAGSTDSINSPEGVLFAEIAALVDGGVDRYIVVSDGSTTNAIGIYFSTAGSLTARVIVGGVSIFLDAGVVTQTNMFKVALKWKLNDFALYVDGVEMDTDTTNPTYTADTLLDLSFQSSAATIFYGKTKQLRVYSSIADAQIDLPYIT